MFVNTQFSNLPYVCQCCPFSRSKPFRQQFCLVLLRHPCYHESYLAREIHNRKEDAMELGSQTSTDRAEGTALGILFAGVFSGKTAPDVTASRTGGRDSRRSSPVSGFRARMTEKAPEADERLPGQYFGRLRFREGGSVQEIRASHPRLPISAGAHRFDLTKARQSAAASRSARTAAATSARVAESCGRRAVSVPAGS